MNIKKIKKMISIFEKSDLSAIELEDEEGKIRLEKNVHQGIINETPIESKVTVENNNEYETLNSPLVGIFYRASSPNDKPFVKEGDYIEIGDVVCLVEAMKTMSEIKSDKAGVVKEILVEDGSPVSYNQPLIKVGE